MRCCVKIHLYFFFFMSAACICRISVRLLLGNVLKTKIFNLSTCELIIFRLTDQFRRFLLRCSAAVLCGEISYRCKAQT